MLAISFNYGELVFFGFGNSLALRFHDLQVLIVNPNAAYKQPFLRLLWIGYDLGTYVKDVQIEFVDLFFTDVPEIILGNLGRLESKRIDPTQVIDIFRSDLGH